MLVREPETVGERVLARRRGDQRVSLRVVDDERVGVVQAAEDLQARPFGRPDDLPAHARVALEALHGARPSCHYFFPAFPALPSFLRTTSPS